MNRNLVTGGSGFIGSNLIRHLLSKKEEVICLDNFITGNEKNIKSYLKNNLFQLINHDVTKPISLSVNKIWHLALVPGTACPCYISDNSPKSVSFSTPRPRSLG